MRKLLFPGLVGLLLLILAACGSSATAVPAAKQAPAAPAAAAQPAAPAAAAQPAAPAAAAKPAAPAAAAAPSALAKYAAEHAGKPGAIYVGDISQLVGPAPTKDQGDFDGNVPLDSLLRHKYVYESDFYKGLLEKAKLTNPTPLVSTGQNITIQHACINRTLITCKVWDTVMFPNVLARTNGQLKLVTSSYPELGLAGPDTLKLLKDGTLAMAEIVGPFVAGDLPALEIQYLFGAFTTREQQFVTTAAITSDVEKLLEEATGGGKRINHGWFSGNDIFFSSKKPLRTLADFKGLKTRAFGTAISDWIIGMGAEAQFVPFADVYTALERGILDAGVSGGDAAHGQRWYEVTKYINGPLISWPAGDMVVNKKVWEKLPPDLQQIMLEEGAKSELEALRIGSVQNELGLLKNTKAGMEYVEFSPELRAKSDAAVLERVIPLWAKRTGGPNAPFVKIFNEKVGPVVGFRVNPDGTAVRIGGPKAPPAAAAAVAAPASPLAAYAAQYAGKPGAIYLGDLKQLVGPALQKDLGDKDGGVTLDSLSRHSWLFDTPYYQIVLKKAKLDNPTPLTTKGKSFKMQYSCINRALQWCKLLGGYFAANVLKRTDGQAEISISSYPELGLGGTDNLRLVADGTLGMTEIYGGFVAGDLPLIELQYLWGLYTEDKTHYLATNAVLDDLDRLIAEKAGGAKVILHNWATGVSQYFFTKKPIRTAEDFKGLKTRSHGTALSDWIIGMGAVPQFVPFAETYTALERGILDAGVTGADPAFGQRWYEVTDYMAGPLVTFTSTNVIMNKKVWEGLPPDIQAILLEEGAKNELEGLRVSPAWNDTGVPKLVDAGLKVFPFSPELMQRSYEVSLSRVIPNWVKRIGGPDSEAAKIFNEKIGPLVNVRINPDGSASKTTK